MKSTVKIMALVLALLFIASCGSTPTNTTASTTPANTDVADATAEPSESTPPALDTSKEVEIVAYFLGNRPPGQDEMDENFNKLAKEHLNCTLESNWISFSEYATRYPLLFSSGEAFDLVYVGSWLNYSEIASKGAFMKLDELFPQYAPNNYSKQTPLALQQATVNGNIYCIPSLSAIYSPYVTIYRTDILKGYDGNKTLDNFADIEKYFEYVKANSDLQPFHVSSAGSRMDDVYMFHEGLTGIIPGLNQFIWFDPKEDSPKVFTYYDYEKTNAFLQMMFRWNEKGYFSKSALSDTDTNKLNNGVAALTVDLYSALEGTYIQHPDWGIQSGIMSKNIGRLPATQDACAVSITSKNPERALALYDLMTGNEEVFRAYYYGMEDVSYKLHDVNGVTQIEMLDLNTYTETAFWCVKTDDFLLPPFGSPPEYAEQVEKIKAQAANSAYYDRFISFNFVTDSIQTEYAACINVHKQYWWPLELGYTDPVTGLEEYKKNMGAAGIDKVLAEAQHQLDAYVQNGYKNP